MRGGQVGIGIMLVGIILLAVGTVGVLATVILDMTAPRIFRGYPNASSSGSPNMLEANVNYDIYCTIYIEKPPEVWVEINGARTNLTYKEMAYGYNKYGATWNSGSEGQSYTFVFKAKDTVGNISSVTTYVRVGVPVGAFYINDQLVTEDSVIYLNTWTLNLKAVFASDAEFVTRVYGDIWKSTTTKMKDLSYVKQADGKTWTESFTATEDGTYEIRAWHRTNGQSWQGLNITMGVNVLPGIAEEFPIFATISAALMIVGAVLVTKSAVTAKTGRL